MKNSYILLRNNKESGSLSLEDLEKIGLKSSDLIWVECQSVSWRGAGEIPELKPLLSAEVKKTLTQKSEQSATIDNPEPGLPVEKPVEKKSVFVELPSIPSGHQKQEKQYFSTDPEAEINRNYSGITGFDKPKVEEKPTELETKYSGSLDELKQMYRKNLEQKGSRAKKIITINIPAPAKKAALYLGLILTGVIATLLISNPGSSKPATQTEQNKIQSAPENTEIQTLSESDNAVVPLQNEQQNTGPENTDFTDSELSTPKRETASTISEKKLPVTSKSQNEGTEPETETVVTEKAEPVNEIQPSKIISPQIVSSDLKVKPNNYVVGNFGGIRNLELTLQNDSKYLLDDVVVEVEYLNYNGITVKKEDIHFQSVPPGSAQTIAVPKSKRGVKIAHKLKKIEAKETGLSSLGAH